MSILDSRLNSDGEICPHCHTVTHEPRDVCGYCGERAPRIDHPAWRDGLALASTPRRLELVAEVATLDGREQRVADGERLHWNLGLGCIGTFAISADKVTGAARIEFAERLETVVLPWHGHVAGGELRVRFVARPNDSIETSSEPGPTPPDVPLAAANATCLGRRAGAIALASPSVAARHAVIARELVAGHGATKPTDRFWILDLGTETGTFVNDRPIVARRLECDDLVRVGPYRWTFNPEDRLLVPAELIEGASLDVERVQVRAILEEVSFSLAPGTLTALVGPAGCGKSTLVKAILGAVGATRGRILADGQDVSGNREWFRSIIGYVSQERIAHGELSMSEAVRFAGELRGRSMTSLEVGRLLRSVDLPEACWRRPCKHLSGGEDKRFRVAMALASRPRLLILDEPASGLDHERGATLMRLLRALAYRGCTILIVTHHREHLEYMDRWISLTDGRVAFDSNTRTPTGAASSQAAKPVRLDTMSAPGSPRGRLARTLSQGRTLLRREIALMTRAWPRRLGVPLAVMPICFAFALAFGVPPTKLALLGFLANLAVVWMGASLGLLAIVDEREIFDHERLLFLGIVPYLAAKSGALMAVSALQTSVFHILLSLRSHVGERDAFFHGEGWVLAVLVLAGWAGLGLGLVISAIAGRHRPLANFILPLAMIAQIVFSAHIAAKGDGGLDEVAGEFHTHNCETEGCRRRATRWLAPSGDDHSHTAPKGWRCERCEREQKFNPIFHLLPDPSEDDFENAKRPHRLACFASYGTISRYGDLALRAFAYQSMDSNPDVVHQATMRTYGYARWFWESVAMLAAWCVAAPTIAGLILASQGYFRFERGRQVSKTTIWRSVSLLEYLRKSGLRGRDATPEE